MYIMYAFYTRIPYTNLQPPLQRLSATQIIQHAKQRRGKSTPKMSRSPQKPPSKWPNHCIAMLMRCKSIDGAFELDEHWWHIRIRRWWLSSDASNSCSWIYFDSTAAIFALGFNSGRWSVGISYWFCNGANLLSCVSWVMIWDLDGWYLIRVWFPCLSVYSMMICL